MRRFLRRIHNEDKAQVLALFGLLTMVIIGLMGLASDIGRIYVARSELARSVDSAALAGAKQLPNIVAADTKARQFIAENEPGAVVSVEVYPDVPSQQVEVRATKTVNTIFLRALGVGTVNVKNSATAGFGIVPVDAYITMDATGSMNDGTGTPGESTEDCNNTQTGGRTGSLVCPIHEAKEGAEAFVNTLIADGSTDTNTVVGLGAFRGCYNLPRNMSTCIDATAPGSQITGLTSNKPTLMTGIGSIQAVRYGSGSGNPSGGSGTNMCLALKKAQSVIFGAGSHAAGNTQRYVILLSDGDNVYNASQVYQDSTPGPESPESPCMPTSPSSSQGDVSANCRNDTQDQEGKVDQLSYDMANTLKGQGVQIYIIAFSVCGGIQSSSVLCNTSGIGATGSSHPDSIADHRLLKCMASSTPGTNDHYFETATATDLPTIFETIAQQIAFRLIK
jgi:hypothetical protein